WGRRLRNQFLLKLGLDFVVIELTRISGPHHGSGGIKHPEVRISAHPDWNKHYPEDQIDCEQKRCDGKQKLAKGTGSPLPVHESASPARPWTVTGFAT